MYNAQQWLESVARAVLFRASTHSLDNKEQEFFDKLLKLLFGHPVYPQIAKLVSKAKNGKLTELDMMQLRVTAGNGQPGEGMDVDEDEDREVHPTENQKIPLPILTQMIVDLKANGAGASTILAGIAEYALKHIYVSNPLCLLNPSERASQIKLVLSRSGSENRFEPEPDWTEPQVQVQVRQMPEPEPQVQSGVRDKYKFAERVRTRLNPRTGITFFPQLTLLNWVKFHLCRPGRQHFACVPTQVPSCCLPLFFSPFHTLMTKSTHHIKGTTNYAFISFH